MQTRTGSYRNPGASDDLGKCFDFHIKKKSLGEVVISTNG